MLSYVASFLLSYMVNGPVARPGGDEFSAVGDVCRWRAVHSAGRPAGEWLGVHHPVCRAGLLAVQRQELFWPIMEVGGKPRRRRAMLVFAQRTGGSAWCSPASPQVFRWLAGEVAGPVGQLNLNISPGYGFAAIIVAYLPFASRWVSWLAGALMALITWAAKPHMALQLPAAITGIFSGACCCSSCWRRCLYRQPPASAQVSAARHPVAWPPTELKTVFTWPRAAAGQTRRWLEAARRRCKHDGFHDSGAGHAGGGHAADFAGLGELVAERSGVINLAWKA